MPTGGFNTSLDADAVLTAIDAALWEEYDRERQPDYLTVRSDMFFKQGSLSNIGFIWDEYSNVGNFRETGEQEEFTNTDVRIGNTTTKKSVKYAKQIPISDEAFRADNKGLRAQIGNSVGDRARQTQDQVGILNSYGDAFAGSVNTTPDGAAPASNSHTTLTGVTVDNLETGALTPDNLWTAVQSLATQKAQDGEAGSHYFDGLIVPFNLYKTAKEVLDSTLVANGGENNINIFDTVYGTVAISNSIFLTSTYNSASNAATSYHLVSRNHMWMRKVFYGMTTNMVPPEYSANDTYIYRAKFHEVVFPGSYTGYVGSNGSTA